MRLSLPLFEFQYIVNCYTYSSPYCIFRKITISKRTGMKKIFLLLMPFMALIACNNGGDHHQPSVINTFLPTYNAGFYTDVLSAAQGIGMPFLLAQKYFKSDTVWLKNDSTLLVGRDSVLYNIYENYVNPDSAGIPQYFVNADAYDTFGITGLKPIWPMRAPYAFYNRKKNTFNATFDCVGFGTRVLSAIGDTSVQNNPYLNLQNAILGSQLTGFAHAGRVAEAYQFAVSFPLVDTVPAGWQYISGGLAVDSIRKYDTSTNVKYRHNYRPKNRGNFQSAMAGDILAFGYAPLCKDNGHFMVMANSPVRLDSASLTTYLVHDSLSADSIGRISHTYRVYAVEVFDCSGIQSHFKDSRTIMSGIGHGTLILLTNLKTDVPEGFIFGRMKDTTKTNNAGNNNELKQGTVGVHVFAISVGRWNAKGEMKK